MNIEKQTLYNTEQLKELYEKRVRAVGCFGKSRRYGGVRFLLRRKAEVTLGADFLSLEGGGTFYLDGARLGGSEKPFFETKVTLEAGEHLFEGDFAVTHGGFRIYAEGVGLEEGRRYFDRIGGYQSGSETVVYEKNGDRTITKYTYASGALSSAETSNTFYDEAYLYDRTNGAYTATRRSLSSSVTDALTVNNGVSQSIGSGVIKSAAICDARTLEAGADYLVAYTDANGNLRFYRTEENALYDASCLRDPIVGIRRVLSAQKGSIFLVEDKSGFWTGWFFHAAGANALAFSQRTFHYDKIPLCRNRHVAPSATASDADGTPIFWYRREDGKLMRFAHGGTPTFVGYEEGCYPASSGKLVQSEGDLRYYAQ